MIHLGAIEHAWLHKEPKVSVLQAKVNSVQEGECWTPLTIPTGVNIFHWIFLLLCSQASAANIGIIVILVPFEKKLINYHLGKTNAHLLLLVNMVYTHYFSQTLKKNLVYSNHINTILSKLIQKCPSKYGNTKHPIPDLCSAVLIPQLRRQFYQWLMLYNIVTVHWCRNIDEFLIIFTFWIWIIARFPYWKVIRAHYGFLANEHHCSLKYCGFSA